MFENVAFVYEIIQNNHYLIIKKIEDVEIAFNFYPETLIKNLGTS